MRHAFTLLELLLVLVLLGVMSAITAARLGGMRGSQAVEQAAQQVHDQSLRCQHLAAGSGQAVRLRLDPRELSATVQVLGSDGPRDPADGQDPRVLLGDGSEALTMAFARSDGVARGDGPVDVLFLPDARCDPPGLLTFANRTRSAAVRWHAGARPPTLELTSDAEPRQ
jgi:prepilin-type N-terminal cleavage/methylation domain-containing protein